MVQPRTKHVRRSTSVLLNSEHAYKPHGKVGKAQDPAYRPRHSEHVDLGCDQRICFSNNVIVLMRPLPGTIFAGQPLAEVTTLFSVKN